MANQTDQVNYNFTGDVSSLERATQEAINLLDKYENTVKDLALSGNLDVGKTVFGNFNKTINGITKQVNSLVTSLNKSTKDMQIAMIPDTKTIQSFSNDLRTSLTTLSSSSHASSEDIKQLTAHLKETQTVITSVADKAKILSASFTGVKQLSMPKFDSKPLQQATAQTNAFTLATSRAEMQTNTSMRGISSAYAQLIQNASFRNYAQEVEASYERINKSARESAEVLTSVSSVQFEDKLERIRVKSQEVAEALQNTFRPFANLFQPFSASLQQSEARMQSFRDVSSSTFDGIKSIISAAASGFRTFGDSADAAASDSAALVEGIGAISPKIAIAVKAFKVFQKVLSGLKPVVNGLKSIFSKIGSSIQDLGPKVSGLTGNLKSLIPVIGGFKIGDILGQSFEKAVSYIENLNLFTVAMGESINEANKFIDTMSEVYGMDPSNLYRYAGYFYQLSDAIGSSAQASKNISLSLTRAANDIGSLFNVEIEQVVNNLASGMQGMSMAVRKYGIDIRQATLQQTALNYGFQENVSSTSEANRQALRFLTIMDQVKNATKQVTTTVDGSTVTMGDFARNIETPANQLRIFKEQMAELARSVGNFFIPVFQKCLYVINGVVMAIKTLLQFLAALIGIDISGFGGEVSQGASAASDAAGAVGDIGSSASKSAKELKKLIAPFDELTILTENKGSDSGGGGGAGGIGGDMLDPSLAAAIENMSLGLDDIRMKALDVRDKILELLGLHWDNGEIVVTAEGFIDDLIHLWDQADYTGFGARIAEFLNQGIGWGVAHTDPSLYVGELNAKVAAFAQILNGLIANLDWEGLGTIVGNGITIALNGINTFFTEFDWVTLGASFATGINGLVNAVDWSLLGETIANYFMTTLWSLQGFFESFDWVTLGFSLATGFMSLLNTIDWYGMGATVSEGINGVMDTILTFLNNYEWGSIGTSIADGLNGAIRTLNWRNVGKTISNVMRALLKETIGFLSKLDWYALGEGIGEMLASINWLNLLTDVLTVVLAALSGAVKFVTGILNGIVAGIAKNFIDGFQNGLVDGIKNIGSWLNTHFVKPIVDAVKALFGIASPSKVAVEIGKFFTEGLKNGILEPIKSIGGWLKTSIVDPILNGIKSAFGISGSDSSVMKNIGQILINGLHNGIQGVSKIKSVFDNLASNVKNSFNNIATNIGNAFSSATTKISEQVNKIKTTVSNIPKTITAPQITTNTSNIRSTSIRTPKMATGGVVTGPTRALIGEGRYDEAVIPLGNSPQIEELIGKIASAVSATSPRGNSAGTPIEVHVFLDSKEITTAQNRTNRMYGRTQQNI